MDLRFLAIIPILNFVVLYVISRFRNMLSHLKGLYALTVLDWAFVPFNYLIGYSINFSWKIFCICVLIVLIPLIILHYKWHKIQKKPDETKYFTTDKGLTPEGWVHFIFMAIEVPLVIMFIVSNSIKPYYYYAAACLFAYILGYFIIIHFVRRIRLISKIEFPILIIGLILLIARVLINY
jgi:hypothetical protein